MNLQKKILTSLLFFVFTILVYSQWATDPTVNNPICLASNYQDQSQIIKDDNGGAIIVWEDFRNGFNYDIYAQRISNNGVVQWTANGVVIASVINDQTTPQIIADGNGGAIITWNDFRGGNYSDIYAQKISANGIIQWTANGIPVCTAINSQHNPAIVCDGAGGAIITWQDKRDGALDIYAQRINANGTALWADNGISICNEIGIQENPSIASDGTGGAIITWQDYRSSTDYDIYAQRINNNGTVQWTENGIAVCVATNDQYTPSIAGDGNGGAIISWWDFRNGLTSSDSDIYTQQVSHDGQLGVVTGVEENITSLPESFHLYQNYPNPFNPSTKISWQSPVGSWQTLKVYDILGNEVATLVDEYKPAGIYKVEFNVAHESVRAITSGVYFYQLKARDYLETKKMILIK